MPPSPPPRPRALVFDLDGTLVDSVPDLAEALNRVLAMRGRDTLSRSAVKTMVGDGVPKLVERGFMATGGAPDDLPALVDIFLGIYEKAATVHTAPFPGVVATLQRLRDAGHAMAVCTNKPYLATRTILEGLDLARFFDACTGGDSFAVRKPDAGHLLGTLEQIGAGPDDAVMIGDSPNDVAVARNAGVPAIALTYGYTTVPATELGADILLDRFEEIPEALARLG